MLRLPVPRLQRTRAQMNDTHALVPGRLVAVPAGAAVVAEVLAWGLLVLPGTLGPSWYGNPRLLAAVHLLTVGALAMSILGFGWQLVPVLTAAPPLRGWIPAARWINRLCIAGAALLCVGMLWLPAPLAGLGGGLLIAGLLARTGAVVWALMAASGRRAQRGWLLAGELCLLAGLALGGSLLLGRLGWPILSDPISRIAPHARLLLLGWVGGWIGGLSVVLLPMFAVAPAPRPVLIAAAGLAWFAGVLLGSAALWGLGAALLVGGLLHAMHRRVQRRMGPGILTAMFGLTAMIGLAVLGLRGGGVSELAAALVLAMLPVLRGVGLRIGPFLLWTHRFTGRITSAPSVAALIPARAALAAGGLAVLGGALVVAGISGERWSLAQLGAGAALVGAVCHAVVLLTAIGRGWRLQHRSDALPGMEAR